MRLQVPSPGLKVATGRVHRLHEEADDGALTLPLLRQTVIVAAGCDQSIA